MNPLFYEEHCLHTYNFVHFTFVFHFQTALLFLRDFFVYVLLLVIHLSVAQLSSSERGAAAVRVDNFFFSSWAMKLVTRTEKNSKWKLCTQLLRRDVRQKKLEITEQNRANWEIWSENVSTRRNRQSKGHLMAWQF